MKIYAVRWGIDRYGEKDGGIFDDAFEDRAEAVKSMKADAENTLADWRRNPNEKYELEFYGKNRKNSINPCYVLLSGTDGWKMEWFIDELNLK